MPKLAQCQQDTEDLLSDPERNRGTALAGLRRDSAQKGQELTSPAMRFTFPAQLLDAFPHGDEKVLYLTARRSPCVDATIDRWTVRTVQLDMEWDEKNSRSDRHRRGSPTQLGDD